MRAVETVETNHNFGPPSGKEDRIGNLPCKYEEVEELGMTFVYAVYELSEEDRRAIANGWNIRVGVGWLGQMPPISMSLTSLTEKVKEGV